MKTVHQICSFNKRGCLVDPVRNAWWSNSCAFLLSALKSQHSGMVSSQNVQVWRRFGLLITLSWFLIPYSLFWNQHFCVLCSFFLTWKDHMVGLVLLTRDLELCGVEFSAWISRSWSFFLLPSSGWEQLSPGAPSPAFLRGAEGAMGARPGWLHGNGLLWQYQEKARHVPEMRWRWEWHGNSKAPAVKCHGQQRKH